VVRDQDLNDLSGQTHRNVSAVALASKAAQTAWGDGEQGNHVRAAAQIAAKSSLEMPLRALNYRLPLLEPEQLSLNSSPVVGYRDDE
jgi:hypothetical protein